MSESTKNHAGQSDPQGADPRADWGWRERMLFSICLAPPAEVPQSRNPTAEVAPVYKPGERLTRFCRRIPGVTRETFTAKLVIDFGSGLGDLVMDLAGVARESIGLEIRPELNAIARERARAAGIENARFLLSEEFDFTRDKADYIISTDAMEHFEDVSAILGLCAQYLKPGGRMLAAFNPPWAHPRGHHMNFMCRLPWFHLVFGERTIMNVRRLYRGDGARRYRELSGGLGQLTLRKFRRAVAGSPFEIEHLQLTPIRGTRPLTWLPGGEELFTSDVACVLRLRS